LRSFAASHAGCACEAVKKNELGGQANVPAWLAWKILLSSERRGGNLTGRSA
jgi:hypothetical protein